MTLFAYFWPRIRGLLLVFLLALVVFLPLFYYTSMNVETALLEREVRRLENKRESLIKKNAALRSALARLSRARRSHPARTLKNRVVRIRLVQGAPSRESARP